ncbi:Co/Zn/Cd cation transporter [Bifidobacterium pullorum subsp. saeculare DSM 6531 = LMG 14934]|uniref:Co/Zn/Cd cation transporter n=1 Tax=Bifidobacterium pullorum subsp. saeculare DSM 6531 = LMG 14934 TaxID=1437611 RepID=A0A087CZI4_9BIFI|nr:cation transporter [Bifidobacterium pullorum]KFI88684.1 Co/Zn/Cd cation transporter [Bifidobacterium pullorum subsp. saeculare DSM 6531 = LMG 14934]
MQHKQIERKALGVGIIINILMVVAGAIVFFMTGLKAMFLDTTFTVISVVSGLVATYLSSRTVRTTERFPNGMFALEPIYAICKAIFTLSLLVFSFLDVAQVAWDYFVLGVGERASFGPVVIYQILTVATCFGLLVYYRRQNARIGDSSMMLRAEAQSTLVDGMISFGIGLAAVVLVLLPAGGPLDFLHYTGDFFITTVIVILAVKEPVEVLRDAFVELVGGVHDDDETNTFVEQAAQRHLPANTEYEKTMIFKTGMNYTVDVYLAGTGESIDVADLVECKRSLERELKHRLHIVDVDLVFD